MLLFTRSLRLLALVALFSTSLCAADSPNVANAIPEQNLPAGVISQTVNLANVFALSNVSGPLVEFDFSIGKMVMTLYPDVAPKTVANFLRYTDNDIYDNTFVHRAIKGFVVQAGGYEWKEGVPHVPTYSPVVSEYNLPNVAGTLAMAKLGGDLNSATSEWFVNLVDNPALDDALDSQGNPQKFTVFGRLIGDGLTFSKSIAALPNVNAGGALNNLPVVNYTNGKPVGLSNLVVLQTVRRIPLLKLDGTSGYLALTARSSAPNVIAPSIVPAGLLLSTSATAGEATITVTATDFYGQSASTSFVARSATPSFAITVKATPKTYGRVVGAKNYLAGKKATVKAVPTGKFKFLKWTEKGKTVSTKASYSFFVTKSRNLVAVFTK